ncbi:ATP-dependent helicase, partial [Patescibacteria group bacterium]|nr:ATP-dependent helicase [Patescibacteria group bacterium]
HVSVMKEFVLQPRGFDPANCRVKYREELNPEQLEAVLKGDGPCLVLAGAGSGKTRTITYRVSYLIENGVAPEEILLLTFTNKAAREMLSRVEALLCRTSTGIWGGTFHSIANRLLRRYALHVSRTPGFSILDEEDARDLLKLCLKDLAVDTTARRFPSPANLSGILSYARNADVSVRAAIEKKHPHWAEIIPIIERLSDLYASRKLASDAMDFDDLLLLLRDLLRDQPQIRDYLATQFRYVLVDEYQDTNVVQAEIVRHLSSVHGNVFVVGDDAQSIYSFRAADIKNILRFPDIFPGTQTFQLVTNYRSTPQILSLANAVIHQNRDQFEKDLCAVRDPGETPNVVPASNASQEAQYVAEHILRLREEGVPLKETAVLFRAAYLAQTLEFELMKRDIPYEFRGGMKFFQRAHVKDVVAHLRLVVNPKDEPAWMRVLSLQPGIGATTAGTITQALHDVDMLEEALQRDIKVSARAVRGLQLARNTLSQIVSARTRPGDAIRAVASSSYREALEAEYPDYLDRLEDLEQFAIFAEGYADIGAFLEDVSLSDNYGGKREQGEREEEKIVLSTIHQAKGLEWDTVFVIGLVEGKFPNERALEEDGGIEEERRLFYVASTRARTRLILTYPIMSGHDTLLAGQPSTFISEMPSGLTEEVRLRSLTPSWASSSVFRSAPPKHSAEEDQEYEDDEITIVLDANGERTSSPAKPSGKMSFLRDIEDL